MFRRRQLLLILTVSVLAACSGETGNTGGFGTGFDISVQPDTQVSNVQGGDSGGGTDATTSDATAQDTGDDDIATSPSWSRRSTAARRRRATAAR